MEKTKKRLILNACFIGGAILFYVLYRLSFLVPGFVEDVYSRGFFKLVSQGLSTATGILPFSLAEFLFYGFFVFILAYFVYTVIKLFACPDRRFLSFLCRIIALIAVIANVFTAFVILWGFNYARQPLAVTMQLNVAPSKKEVLFEVCKSLVDEANALRQDLKQNDDGVFVSRYTKQEAMAKVPELYAKVANEKNADFFGGSYGVPKGILASKGLSYSGILGIYFPFSGEANVNTDVPMLTFLSGACHEAAHQHGFAREDEANFIAYYICHESGDSDFMYSGDVLALLYASNALYDADRDLYTQLNNKYSDALKRDLHDYSAYWDGFKGPAEEAVTAMNNTYLKANMQEDGVKSYGRMVDLLIAQYGKEQNASVKL